MGFKRFIQTLGPYQSLALLAVPTATVEPLKIVAVAIAGAGHWITGAAMIVACYTLSLVVVERLFIIGEAQTADDPLVREDLAMVRSRPDNSAPLVQKPDR